MYLEVGGGRGKVWVVAAESHLRSEGAGELPKTAVLDFAVQGGKARWPQRCDVRKLLGFVFRKLQ